MKKFKKKKLDDATQKSSFIEEYFVKIKEENEKIEKMMSNIDYIKWLYQFTQEIDAFSSETWLYCPEKLSASDRKNVDQLDLFYEGIKKYANQNYIYPTPCEFGNFYKIRLNEIGFEIGKLIGQGILFFCKRVQVENEQEFIDFNDIMNGKEQKQVEYITTSLKSLSDMVLNLYKSGIPLEAIKDALNNTIEEITYQQEDKKLILKK